MARKPKHKQQSAAETLDAIESRGDEFANWIGDNPVIILGVSGVILLSVAAYGLIGHQSESGRDEASMELSELQTEFRTAMGSSPDELDLAEPANPETAQQVRSEYVERFQALVEAHPGTPVAALAALEEATLQQATADLGGAIATLNASLEGLGDDEVLRGVVLARIASLHEADGKPGEAAASYESAAEVAGYPLRYGALAEAARCLAEAGEVERALSVYARIQAEAPEQKLPAHIESRLRELKVRPEASAEQG